jgi:GxxExxY protein
MVDAEECASVAIDLGLKIHRDLGPGMLESVYEGILAGQLQRAGLVVERQRPIPVEYDGMVFHEGFRADLLVGGTLIIEVKSVEQIAPVHGRQVLTYLRMSKLTLGLLMNFGAQTFREGLRRIVNNHPQAAQSPLVSRSVIN